MNKRKIWISGITKSKNWREEMFCLMLLLLAPPVCLHILNKGIELFVELNCDRDDETEKEPDKENTEESVEENQQQQMMNNNPQIRGRKIPRQASTLRTVSEESRASRQSDPYYTQSHGNLITTESRGRSKGRKKGKTNRQKFNSISRRKGKGQRNSAPPSIIP
ncbi:hypothetical protein K7X08_009747 [Anisodus acutangulus]|uniref:Uncharacterized protein n=1 Tax=Anisodus acutangulus TaxID=402998 RepID=A0A9Q1N1H0_9SOLA|nr:hypothetical protein K7X08_009747 [Anisodus acutangulus]